MSLGLRPCSQPKDQKEALCPSPRVIVVQAAKQFVMLDARHFRDNPRFIR
jgi:hypothetical protein